MVGSVALHEDASVGRLVGGIVSRPLGSPRRILWAVPAEDLAECGDGPDLGGEAFNANLAVALVAVGVLRMELAQVRGVFRGQLEV